MNQLLFKYSKYLMLFGGLWQRPFFQNKAIQAAYKVYSAMLQIYFCILCSLMLSKLFDIIKANDLEKLTGTVVITLILSALKTINYRYGGFMGLIQIILDKEQEVLVTDDLMALKKIYMESVNYVYKFSALICGSSIGNTLILVISQSLSGLLGDYSDSIEKPMIFLANFPFNQNERYKTALLVQGVSMIIAVLFYDMTQVTYITVVTYVKMELRLLQCQFREFDRFKRVYNIDDDEVMMRRLIKRHQFIISFTNDLNKSLRLIILMEFLLSSINIAFVALQLISGQTEMPLPFTLNYLCILFVQLLILAWHANEISVESVGLSYAIWELPWYEKSIKVQKLVYLTLCRSQKPLTLTIGPFGVLTTQTVINVMNAAYSYVNIMTNSK